LITVALASYALVSKPGQSASGEHAGKIIGKHPITLNCESRSGKMAAAGPRPPRLAALDSYGFWPGIARVPRTRARAGGPFLVARGKPSRTGLRVSPGSGQPGCLRGQVSYTRHHRRDCEM